MKTFKQFLMENTIYFKTNREYKGENYDKSEVIIPKGTRMFIEYINTSNDGSIRIIAYDQTIKLTLHYDNKKEAEQDLGVDL